MLTLYFFYGLAFVALGAAVLLLPKRIDYLGIGNDLWPVGLFGLFHGVGEWVDLFIARAEPFDVETLQYINAALLPLSFIFLIIFGSRIISRERREFFWLKYFWIICLTAWLAAAIVSKDILISSIMARYLICIPGTILSAAGLYLGLLKARKNYVPRIISISAWAAIAITLIYCFLSGLITPSAGFFPASIFNYENFRMVTGLPVQLFRTLCAVGVCLSFFSMVGFFQKKATAERLVGGIKHRITLIICAAIGIVMLIALALTYLFGMTLLENTIGRQYKAVASMLGEYVTLNLAGEIEDVRTYASRPRWIEAVAKENALYDRLSEETIIKNLERMDSRWVSAGKNDPFVAEYLHNTISRSMEDLIKIRSSVAEIFITDKYGGIVASSGKTSDFYQADEEWWQKAYNNGKGAIFISGAEFDESSNAWVISIAVPIMDSGGKAIGVCKDSISLARIFAYLENFRIGKTGHAVIIDNNGYALFHHRASTMNTPTRSAEIVEKLRAGRKSYSVIEDRVFHKDEKMFVTFSEVHLPLFTESDSTWILLISQNLTETFKPINDFVLQMIFITIILILTMVPVGSLFGDFFARPIRQFQLAAERIAAGDWNYAITIKTGDEIELLATSFGNMIQSLKNKQEEAVLARDALEDLLKNLEKKVEERTKDLNLSQEATLNILEDLTEARDKLEKKTEALEEALQIKSEFTSTVSHELRTPLAAVKESISLVSDGTAGPVNHDQKDFLDTAKRNVDRLSRLINDILDFQKLEAGKIVFNMDENDINEVVNEVARAMAPLASEKHIEFTIDMDEDIPRVKFDRDRIMQVLTNLIGNAIKFTHHGSITIFTKTRDNVIEVSVEDTGPGINKEALPRLFQRFEQLEKGGDRKTGGTGLGLAISKEIVERHRGKIWVESEPGKGSAFKFILPINPSTGSGLYPERPSTGSGSS